MEIEQNQDLLQGVHITNLQTSNQENLGSKPKTLHNELQDNHIAEDSEDQDPLIIQCKSKNWKIRQNTYKELERQFKITSDRNQKIFQKFPQEIPNILSDSNPGSQLMALLAFKSYLQKIDRNEFDLQKILKILIEKCFASNKQNIRSEAQKVFSMLFELQKSENGQVKEFVESLVWSLSH